MKKTEFSSILNGHQSIQSLAAKVADLEAKIVIAERRLEDAMRDDGVSPPEAIYSKTEDARRALEIQRIESNRAAAKLTEAEENLKTIIRAMAPEIAARVQETSTAAAAKITEQALQLFGESARDTQQMIYLIEKCPAVAEPAAVAHRIRICCDMYLKDDRVPADFVSNVLSAEKFL
jgi:hypothetical protein